MTPKHFTLKNVVNCYIETNKNFPITNPKDSCLKLKKHIDELENYLVNSDDYHFYIRQLEIIKFMIKIAKQHQYKLSRLI